LSILVGSGLVGLGALTNPDQSAYENYAVDRIGELAREQCNKAPAELGVILRSPCRAAVDAYKSQLRPLLAASTTHQNWIVLSIYKSELSIPAVNLNARIESIGIFNNFFTYRASGG
jgi:Domain of unknown function (DUF4359)